MESWTTCRTHVLAHQCAVQRGRQLFEDFRVLAHEPEERRPPRRQRNDVDQSERAIAGSVDKVGAQRNGTAEIVADHHGLRECPVRE